MLVFSYLKAINNNTNVGIKKKSFYGTLINYLKKNYLVFRLKNISSREPGGKLFGNFDMIVMINLFKKTKNISKKNDTNY